ncbi:hypothetical protein ACFO1B_33205 [Dactylosporangium siamense]|uniref:Uncharacterized protein n=1 Tax=Dactylosporangium siamense TaxID=685454 RepID=A0A919PD24_9ACTN|nr:hypothetical protein [Dactylosporangium siamense]GIG42540.1 hypothetical protein Dsi01nite_005810 [Dactylosporangium siamense]
MKKVFLILGIIAGSLLLLCCGGGVALYFFADTNTYAKPADVCATVNEADGSGAWGIPTGTKTKDTNAFGRTYSSCVVTLPSDGTLTVAIDVTSSKSDAREHYDAVKKIADNATSAGATVATIGGIGAAAFSMSTNQNNALMYELDFYDDNLYISLNLTTPTGTTLTADKVRTDFTFIAKGLMKTLKASSSSGSDWDD